MKHLLRNKRYYAMWLLMQPFYFLDWIIFFECPTHLWLSDIWLHRCLLWHDNLYDHEDNYKEMKPIGHMLNGEIKDDSLVYGFVPMEESEQSEN